MLKKNIYLAFVIDVESFYLTGKIKCILPDQHFIKFLKENKEYFYLDKIDLKNDNNFFKKMQTYISKLQFVEVACPSSFATYDTGIFVVPALYSFCYVMPVFDNFETNNAVLIGFTNEGYTEFEESSDKDIKDFPLPFKFPSPFAQREETTIKNEDGSYPFKSTQKKDIKNHEAINNTFDKPFRQNSIIIKQKYTNIAERDAEQIPTENLIIIDRNGIEIYKRKIVNILKTNEDEKNFSDIGNYKDEPFKSGKNITVDDINNFQKPDLTKQFYNSILFNDNGIKINIFTNKKDNNVKNTFTIGKDFDEIQNLTQTKVDINNNKIKINIENPFSEFKEISDTEFDVEEKRERTELELSEKALKFLIKANDGDNLNYLKGDFSLNYEINNDKIANIKPSSFLVENFFKKTKTVINNFFNDGKEKGIFEIVNADVSDENKTVENKIFMDLENLLTTLNTQNDKDIAQAVFDAKNNFSYIAAKDDNNEISVKLDKKNKQLIFYAKEGKIIVQNEDTEINIEKDKDLTLTTSKKFIIDAKEVYIKDGGDTVPLLSKLEQLFNDNLVNHTHVCSHGGTGTSTQCAKLSSLQKAKSKKIKTD